MPGEIQEGINWQEGTKGSNFFKLILLRPASGLSTSELFTHLSRLWGIWGSLKRGIVPSLGPDYPVDPSGLRCLMGFGHRFFERNDLAKPRPEGMIANNRFPQPAPGRDSPVLPGAGILFDRDVEVNQADQEMAVQFTADTPLAIHRAQIETWRYLHGVEDDVTGQPPLSISSFFDGFGREDRRSWIDFHDGISNLRKGLERMQVIAIKPDNAGGQEWTLNGTYLVFMRLPINLPVWQNVSLSSQELLVGRTKRSGSPLIGVDDQGLPLPDPRCPVPGTREIIDPGNENFREPTGVVPDSIKASHVQRANQHRPVIFRPDSRRIYRQGFEFLESADSESGFRVGLNFVSFQDDPVRVFAMLTQSDWLGNLSFGGNAAEQASGIDRLITVRAAGTFFVPPVHATASFPGSDMFPA